MNHRRLIILVTFLLALALMTGPTAQAAGSDPLKAIIAAEEIEITSQALAKDYFYIHQHIREEQARKDLGKNLQKLESAIALLEKQTGDDQQAVIEYLRFALDEIRSILSEKYSKENGALILDYSETLLEGSETLLKSVETRDTKKQAMVTTLEHMDFLLERLSKYYIAFRAGFRDHTAVQQARKAVADFDARIGKIKAYHYPPTQQTAQRKLLKYWPIARKFYLGLEKNDLPLIVFVSTDYLDKAIATLLDYHESR